MVDVPLDDGLLAARAVRRIGAVDPADVSDIDVSRIGLNSEVLVYIDEFKTVSEGYVSFVADEDESMSGKYNVLIEITNYAGRFRHNQYAVERILIKT